MNKVTLIGRLTREPDIRYSDGTKGSFCVARYTLAVNRKFKTDNQPDADFIQCVAISKNGEFAEKYLVKGMKIAVVGEWRTGNYKNKDGQTVYTNELFVNEHEFVESKATTDSNNYQSHVAASEPTAPAGDGFMNIPDSVDDSGLPFNF